MNRRKFPQPSEEQLQKPTTSIILNVETRSFPPSI